MSNPGLGLREYISKEPGGFVASLMVKQPLIHGVFFNAQ